MLVYVKKTLHVPTGMAVVFDALTVHAGSEYAERHHRVHMYLDREDAPRVANRVYVLHKQCPRLDNVISSHLLQA